MLITSVQHIFSLLKKRRQNVIATVCIELPKMIQKFSSAARLAKKIPKRCVLLNHSRTENIKQCRPNCEGDRREIKGVPTEGKIQVHRVLCSQQSESERLI